MNNIELNLLPPEVSEQIADEFIRTIFYAFYSQFLKIVNSDTPDTDDKSIEQTSYPPQTP